MKKFVTFFKTAKELFWEESPWIRAAGIIAASFTGMLLLNAQLPDGVAIDLGVPGTGRLTLGIITVIYFFLVAILSGDKLRFEKKLRRWEQSFRYDKRGTLFNGKEPNIAFRIKTLKLMLTEFCNAITDDEASNVLQGIGKKAATDFSISLPNIYDFEIARGRFGKTWNDLPVNQKLSQWAEYDSSTGWGILTTTFKDDVVVVRIDHYFGLYSDGGGEYFSHILAGYCETVVTSIIDTHKIGRYTDSTGVKIASVEHPSEETLVVRLAVV